MLLDDFLNNLQLSVRQTMTSGHFDGRLNPELSLTTTGKDMHMYARFFPREEEEPKSLLVKYRWTHLPTPVLVLRAL
jgi:hypothetical protein